MKSLSQAAIEQGDFLATVAVMVVAQIKVRADSKQELHDKLMSELTTGAGEWNLNKFAVKEATVQVTPLSAAQMVPVVVKASNPEELMSAIRAEPQAAS